MKLEDIKDKPAYLIRQNAQLEKDVKRRDDAESMLFNRKRDVCRRISKIYELEAMIDRDNEQEGIQ